MARNTADDDRWHPSVTAYRAWLEKHNPQLTVLWLRRLSSETARDREAAVAEAVVWDYLASRVDSIAPAESPSTGGPDFLCHSGGVGFYAEATNLSEDKTAAKTGLDRDREGPTFYSPLTSLIRSRILDKAGQLSTIDLPLVVFVSTLQWPASVVCVERGHLEALLTGTPFLSAPYDRKTGEASDPVNTVNFRDSLFVRISPLVDVGAIAERRHISAVVVGGFGAAPPAVPVFGVLHPSPARPFDPRALPDVPFGHLNAWPPAQRIEVLWSDESPRPPTSEQTPKIILPNEITFDDIDQDNLRT